MYELLHAGVCITVGMTFNTRTVLQSNPILHPSVAKSRKSRSQIKCILSYSILNSAAEKKKERGPKDCSSSQEQKSEKYENTKNEQKTVKYYVIDRSMIDPQNPRHQ